MGVGWGSTPRIFGRDNSNFAFKKDAPIMQLFCYFSGNCARLKSMYSSYSYLINNFEQIYVVIFRLFPVHLFFPISLFNSILYKHNFLLSAFQQASLLLYHVILNKQIKWYKLGGVEIKKRNLVISYLWGLLCLRRIYYSM